MLVCLMLALALPAFAEGEKGEANITPQTTMKELRENPSIKGSGIYTYVYVWERDCGLLKSSKDNDTMLDVIGKESINSCVAGMNFLIDTYNTGTQITYKLYTPEEIAEDKTRDHAELYYFPADKPNAKYAVVLSGNALFYSVFPLHGNCIKKDMRYLHFGIGSEVKQRTTHRFRTLAVRFN